MEIEKKLLAKLDLSTGTDKVVNGSLDRFPPLIIDRCLKGAKSEVVSDLIAGLGSNRPFATETITMPRRTGHGPRPATIAMTGARALYRALVTSLDGVLPEASRSSENRERYNRFASELDQNYLVQLDIAACYEYIEHTRLRTELLAQSMDTNLSAAVVDLLGEIMGRSRGLPQMHWGSDRLADAYLNVLTRYLERHGIETVRYVDDIKTGAPHWDKALEIVELAAEGARSLGLALSAEKTKILKKETVERQRNAEIEVLGGFFESTNLPGEDEDIFALAGPYGELDETDDEEPETTEPDAADGEGFESSVRAALWKLVNEWYATEVLGSPESEPSTNFILQQYLAFSVPYLIEYIDRLPDSVLQQWAFRDPSAVRPICIYILGRANRAPSEDHWMSLDTVISQARRSPWSKLWLLHAAGKLGTPDISHPNLKKVHAWVIAQLNDPHEIVRAEAAWTAASFGLLSSSQLTSLYREASLLSQHALSAAMTKQSDIEPPIRKAIRDDGPLNGKASEWVEGF